MDTRGQAWRPMVCLLRGLSGLEYVFLMLLLVHNSWLCKEEIITTKYAVDKISLLQLFFLIF